MVWIGHIVGSRRINGLICVALNLLMCGMRRGVQLIDIEIVGIRLLLMIEKRLRHVGVLSRVITVRLRRHIRHRCLIGILISCLMQMVIEVMVLC